MFHNSYREIWQELAAMNHSVIVPYTWYPGEFERSTSKHGGYFNYNPGYHAFRHKEQAGRERSCTPAGGLPLLDPSPCGAKS
jgi:hypothetical protein